MSEDVGRSGTDIGESRSGGKERHLVRFVLRRLSVGIVMLFLSSVLIFTAMRVVPGDPTTSLYDGQGGQVVTPAQQEAIRHSLRLDQSIPRQYVGWLGDAVRGNLGESYFSGLPVVHLIGQRLTATIELALVGVLLGVLIAIPTGIVAALKRGSWVDRAIGIYASLGVAVPSYWLGIMLAFFFGVRAGVLPARGYVPIVDDALTNLRDLILPAVTLAVLVSAPIIRYLRAALVEVLSTDYIRTARGKGLPWRAVVVHHGVPNALLPTLTVVGVILGYVLGGVVYVEYVFGWPGLGALTVDTVQKRDYGLLEGLVLLTVAAFIVVTFLVDLIVLACDPRLRSERSAA